MQPKKSMWRFFLDFLSGELLRSVSREREANEKLLGDLKEERVAWKQVSDSVNQHGSIAEGLRHLVDEETEASNAVLEKIALPKASHLHMPLLIAAMHARIPVWLFGDSGSGKTTAASQAANALGLPFRFVSVCPTTPESRFLGFLDAHSHYHRTGFREVYEKGGIFLIDEIDNGNPSVLSVLNTALSNDQCEFPDKLVKRHKDAIIVAAANTIGRGADVKYIGRNAIDVTTLDRFVFIQMDIDPLLEESFVNPAAISRRTPIDISLGGILTRRDWLLLVQHARAACHKFSIDHLITPRATLYGAKLSSFGVGQTHVEAMCLWKGLRQAQITSIKEEILRTRGGSRASSSTMVAATRSGR